jgi:hypothetical protein
MKSNMHLETILWLNKQIDDIHAKSILVGELLMNENDPIVIKKYDKKLHEFEKELDGINNKIELERRLLAQQL